MARPQRSARSLSLWPWCGSHGSSAFRSTRPRWSPGPRRSSAAKGSKLQDVEEFGLIFDGPWWQVGKLVHYCTGEACCAGGLATTRRRMLRSIRRIVLRCKPCTPEADKWTKHFKASSFFMYGNLCHNLLTELFEVGLAAMRFEDKGAAGPVDATTEHNISWHQVQGKRLERSKAMLRDPEANFSLRSLCFIRESGRLLGMWFMRAAFGRLPNIRDGKRPFLMDLSSSSFSPVACILQHFSSVLTGTPEFLVLLWRERGAESFEDWREKYFDSRAALLRRLLMNIAAWTRRRHKMYEHYPFRLAALADDRVLPSAKRCIVDDFLNKMPCCLPPGIARSLRERDHDRNYLLSPFFSKAIFHWAASTSLSVAEVERRWSGFSNK